MILSMSKTVRDLGIITFLVLLFTFLVWAPYLLHVSSFWGLNFPKTGLETIIKNYDGPNYIVVAKSFYNPDLIKANFSGFLPPTYYAAHFPAYPFLIWLLAPVFGWLHSLLAATVLTTILAGMMFYFLVKDFKLTTSPLWLTILFLVLPGRWLVVHSIGSPEPLFIFTILAAFYFLRKKRFWLVALFGILAQLTKSPGILLFLALIIYLLLPSLKELIKGKLGSFFQQIPFKAYPLLLIPISLLALFYFYGIQYHDFFAYFHSGDNIHLELLPFGVFNVTKTWVAQFWLEDILYIYLALGLGVIWLWKNKLTDLAIFTGVFFVAALFIAHRDLSRYMLPAFPFILIAFEKILNTKEFKILMVIIILGIYLYAQNFILNNTAPIADWGPYL